MTITLSDKDTLTLIYEGLVGGMQELFYCDVEIDWEHPHNERVYAEAKQRLKDKVANGDYSWERRYKWQRDRKESDGAPTICYEDVAVEIVRGGDRIIVRDYNDEDEDVVIELERAKQNLSNAEGWTFEQVIHVLQETGSPDAWSYFNIIQQAMFGRVIYG